MKAISQLELYYHIERTGKLIKIKTDNEELMAKLQKDLKFETIQKTDDNWSLILVKPELSQIIF